VTEERDIRPGYPEPDTPTVDKVKKIIINALENKNYD